MYIYMWSQFLVMYAWFYFQSYVSNLIICSLITVMLTTYVYSWSSLDFFTCISDCSCVYVWSWSWLLICVHTVLAPVQSHAYNPSWILIYACTCSFDEYIHTCAPSIYCSSMDMNTCCPYMPCLCPSTLNCLCPSLFYLTFVCFHEYLLFEPAYQHLWSLGLYMCCLTECSPNCALLTHMPTVLLCIIYLRINSLRLSSPYELLASIVPFIFLLMPLFAYA